MMNGLPYYKAYPRDFVEGTIGLPFEVKCAYRVVIDLIYMQGGRLPDDARYIAGHLGCSLRRWNLIRSELIDRGKLVVSGGFLSNYRADKELETLSKFREKQSENASKTRKNNGLQKPWLNHTEPEPDIEKRDTNVSLALVAHDPVEPDRFSEFWDQYPHRNGAKKGKAAAQKSWQKAIKARASPDQIIAGAMRYAGDRQVLQGYAKDPSTWLNNKGWEDEIEHAENHQRPSQHGSNGGMVAAFAAVASRRSARNGGD